MSQDELAKKYDVHGAVIGRYEREEAKPSIEVAARIAGALEVSLEHLVGNYDLQLEKNVVTKIMDIRKLRAEDRAHVFAMLDAFRQSQKPKRFSLCKIASRPVGGLLVIFCFRCASRQ